LKLTGSEEQRLSRPSTENGAAYQNYLKGRFYWNGWTPQGFQKGIKYFQQATAEDANYAAAYAGLSD